jgi:hypothetical protein
METSPAHDSVPCVGAWTQKRVSTGVVIEGNASQHGIRCAAVAVYLAVLERSIPGLNLVYSRVAAGGWPRHVTKTILGRRATEFFLRFRVPPDLTVIPASFSFAARSLGLVRNHPRYRLRRSRNGSCQVTSHLSKKSSTEPPARSVAVT